MHNLDVVIKSVTNGDTFCKYDELKEENMRVVVITGGHIEDEFALDWLQKNAYDFIIAADSGMNFLYRNRIIPDVIAGDFDSVDADVLNAFLQMNDVEILRLNPVKDDTDTEFVIREAIRRGADEITLLGATGTRLDHVLGNMHLLGIGISSGVKIQIVDAHNRIRIISGSVTLAKEKQFGEYVSLLPLDGTVTGVTLKGFKYPLKDAIIPSFSSLGISNEIIAEEAFIEIKQGTLILIESRD